MVYIVMDLEFNQPFDFEHGEKAEPVEACPFEIVQIGMVKLNEAFETLDTKNMMIRPQLYTRIHPFVEKITGLNAGMFNDCPTFPECYPELIEFMEGTDSVICVWGGSDVKLLFKNITYYNLDYSQLTKQVINVQKLASQHLNRPSGMSIGLKHAVESMEIPTETAFHDALNDAVYTAAILRLVKTPELPVETFDPNALNQQSESQKSGFNTKRLYDEAEKLFGRKLTKKEKGVLRKVYDWGQMRKFNYKKK